MSEGLDSDRLFYNIMNPSNKIQCDDCKRDISKTTKMLTKDQDYCPSCFANQSQFPTEYNVVNKLDFPLLDQEWTADEELMLFEGLEKHGFGNWTEIADFIGTGKTREEVERHYQNIYLESKDCIPSVAILTKRDNNGNIISRMKDSPGRKVGRPPKRPPNIVPSVSSRERAALTVHQTALTVHSTSKSGKSPAEIIGYMPKRGDFEVEYDNDAQLLLAEMEFTDEDTQDEKAMKFRIIDIYNQKLNERIRRKQFVISRGLLDLKEQIRLDRTRTKDEKEIYNMLKVFARFNTADDHEKLVQAVIKERQIRQRIQELKELKRKGFRTMNDVEDELEGKKRKEEKLRKKDHEAAAMDKGKTRRMRKDQNTVEKRQTHSLLLTRDEETLCRKYNLSFPHYSIIREAILRESVRLGALSKDYVFKMFRLNPELIESIFDFLVEEEEITMQKVEA